MQTRIRSRSQPGALIVFDPPSGLTYESLLYEEVFSEVRHGSFKEYGSTTCTHGKCFAGAYAYADSEYPHYEGSGVYSRGMGFWNEKLAALLSIYGATASLNWSKLPSSSDFNIIMMLADIDASIVSLSRALSGYATVGSVSYGILPLLSDLKAILKAILNLLNYSGRYEDVRDVSATLEVPFGIANSISGVETFNLSGTSRLTGTIDLSFIDPRVILDWLGFHPDFGTLWDLIPLSFLVNYIFPIGNFLESFRTGGWVDGVPFEGFQSLKLKVTCSSVCSKGLLTYGDSYHYYSRLAFSDTLECPPWTLDGLETPPLSEALKAFTTFSLRKVGR